MLIKLFGVPTPTYGRTRIGYGYVDNLHNLTSLTEKQMPLGEDSIGKLWYTERTERLALEMALATTSDQSMLVSKVRLKPPTWVKLAP